MPFPSLMNPNIEEDTVFGVHLVTFTGGVDETDAYVECVFNSNITRWVKVAFPFPTFYVITKNWLDKYKDIVFGLVVFEKGIPEKCFLISVAYREDYTQKNPPTDLLQILGVNSQLIFDENNKKARLISENISIEATTTTIPKEVILGTENKTHNSARADKVKECIDDLYDKIADLQNRLALTPVAGNGAPFDPSLITESIKTATSDKLKSQQISSSNTFVD